MSYETRSEKEKNSIFISVILSTNKKLLPQKRLGKRLSEQYLLQFTNHQSPHQKLLTNVTVCIFTLHDTYWNESHGYAGIQEEIQAIRPK